MIEIDIPRFGRLRLEHLLLDLNGAVALDGAVPDVVSLLVCKLAERIHVSLLTADTFGTGKEAAGRLGIEFVLLDPSREEAEQKAAVARRLGPDKCVAIGNGSNDVKLLEECVLGIAVVGREGVSAPLLAMADVAVTDPVDALELLLTPKRLVATLRR